MITVYAAIDRLGNRFGVIEQRRSLPYDHRQRRGREWPARFTVAADCRTWNTDGSVGFSPGSGVSAPTPTIGAEKTWTIDPLAISSVTLEELPPGSSPPHRVTIAVDRTGSTSAVTMIEELSQLMPLFYEESLAEGAKPLTEEQLVTLIVSGKCILGSGDSILRDGRFLSHTTRPRCDSAPKEGAR